MDTVIVFAVLGGLLLLATVIGFIWKSGQGRVSRTVSTRPADVPLELIDTRAAFTLLQFSGPFCSYCAAMRRVLNDATHRFEDTITHREIDITDYPELVTALRISQTPTTVIVDNTGHIHARIHGAAKPAVVDHEIQQALDNRKVASDEYLI